MGTMIDDLSEKERVTLRLIVRGHDAKTAARELGLSVHTINERLRSARGKLGVTSSKEAARLLLASEQSDPQSFVDKEMGDGVPAILDDPTAITQRSRKLALWTGGIIGMSVLFSALTLAFLAAPIPEHSNGEQGDVEALTAELAPIDTASENAAREWLENAPWFTPGVP